VIEGRLDLYSCKLAGADKEVSKSLEQSYLDELASLEALGSSLASAPGTSPVGPLTDSSNRKTLITLILTLNASFPDYDFSSLRKMRTRQPAPSLHPAGAVLACRGEPRRVARTLSAALIQSSHNAGPEDFEKEESLDHVSAKINRDMTWGAERGAGGAVTVQEEVTQKLWKAMEEVICLSECSVYSYRPEGDMDPLSAEGKVCSHYCVFSLGRWCCWSQHRLIGALCRVWLQIWSFNYFFYNKKLKRILYVSCMNSAEEEMEDDDDDYFGAGDMDM
jgi:hypothetical protein